jgi:hypothetical protein
VLAAVNAEVEGDKARYRYCLNPWDAIPKSAKVRLVSIRDKYEPCALIWGSVKPFWSRSLTA